MNEAKPESTPNPTRSLVIERDLPHPPEKVWRALTEGSLIEQWLMPNDFQPHAGHPFQFRSTPMPQWNGIIDCKVLLVEANRKLAYSWASMGLESVVAFTLAPTPTGTRLRMEQSGFRPDQDFAYKGATYGWQNFLTRLDQIVATLE